MTTRALARLERAEPFDRRATPRRTMRLGRVLSGTGDDVIIHDLSSSGMLIETAAGLKRFEELKIDLPEHGPTHAWVAWTSGDYFGCEFIRPIPRAAVSAALLRSFPAAAAGSSDAPDADGADEEEEAPDERYSLTMRLRVILGSAILSWVLILWAVGLL